MVTFWLTIKLQHPILVYHPIQKNQRLGGSVGHLNFHTSSFIKNALLKNTRHVDLLLKMGDVHVAFGILICCFVQHPLYFLQCTSPSFTFTKSFISFDFSIFQVFGCLLGLRSFDSLERLLARKQAFFLIIFRGVGFISTSTIAPTTYLRSWALVVLVIAVRFMVDQHLFLLETLA